VSSRAPHSSQKIASAAFSCWQRGQWITRAPSRRPVPLRGVWGPRRVSPGPL